MWKSAEKGLVYILNNYNFPNHTQKKERLGSDKDVQNMQYVFSELGYTPEVHVDLSRDVSTNLVLKFLECSLPEVFYRSASIDEIDR